ncbi:MAG: TlpA family protein disulfide reductase, partial [Comamonadaceae bacterium]
GQRVLGAVLDAKAPAPPAGVIVAKRGHLVPAMTLTTLDDRQSEIPKIWTGKTTLVNVWASWCAPCLKEMPELELYSVEQAANGAQVVGIALDDASSARAVLHRLDITYANFVDAPGPADASVRLGNPAGVLPYSVLVSADGRVLKTKIGPFEDKADIAAWAQR